ncbi:unnamed protein product [Protopolystoma xenopodis]|uniref:Uncharacterized protein n=1 Tax=Protopolystoma xenopodis TaxID=117903 RepID=A0A3S5CJD2_9PLAT|nr:unnamed protein product [Protopolystoma xenopodis]
MSEVVIGRSFVLRMARLIDDTDYDFGEASGDVPSPRPDFGNYHAYYGVRTRCAPLDPPANMTELRKLG